MTNDRPRDQSGEALETPENEDVEPIPADRSAASVGQDRGERPAIGGSSDGSDAALRSDTDRSQASPGGRWNSGDDLANRLGGGEGRGTGASGAGAATGDMSAGRSDAGAGEPDEDRAAALLRTGDQTASPDAGSPGGMGGAGASTNASRRPPGGESPARRD